MSSERRRMFFMDGVRQMVGEPDGTVHEADPNDPDLQAAQDRLSSLLGIHDALEAIGLRTGSDPRERSEDLVARLMATIHRAYNVQPGYESDIEGDHIDNETPWCSACNALLELAHIEPTDERVGAGDWAIRTEAG